MIRERANALVALIERQRVMQRDLQSLDGFRTQAEVVSVARRRLEPLLRTARALMAREIVNQRELPDGATLRADVAQLLARFSEDSSYILAPNRLAMAKAAVPAFASRLEQQLLASWQTYTRARAPGVNPQVLQVLASIGALRTRVQSVAVGLRDLDQRIARLPTDEADIDQFEFLVTKVGAAWSTFDDSHLPPEVLQFLQTASGAQGAPLHAITKPVQEWLREYGLTDTFRVRQTSPA